MFPNVFYPDSSSSVLITDPKNIRATKYYNNELAEIINSQLKKRINNIIESSQIVNFGERKTNRINNIDVISRFPLYVGPIPEGGSRHLLIFTKLDGCNCALLASMKYTTLPSDGFVKSDPDSMRVFIVQYEFTQDVYDNNTIIDGYIAKKSATDDDIWHFLANDMWDKTFKQRPEAASEQPLRPGMFAVNFGARYRKLIDTFTKKTGGSEISVMSFELGIIPVVQSKDIGILDSWMQYSSGYEIFTMKMNRTYVVFLNKKSDYRPNSSSTTYRNNKVVTTHSASKFKITTSDASFAHHADHDNSAIPAISGAGVILEEDVKPDIEIAPVSAASNNVISSEKMTTTSSSSPKLQHELCQKYLEVFDASEDQYEVYNSLDDYFPIGMADINTLQISREIRKSFTSIDPTSTTKRILFDGIITDTGLFRPTQKSSIFNNK